MYFDCSQHIILENAAVRLSPMTEGDVFNLREIALNETKLVQYSPSQIHNEELLGSYIQTALKDRAKGFRYAFVIFDKTKNRYAGSTSFGSIVNKDQRIEIGWTWIGKDFQRTGLNRNMKFLMMRYVFETLQFERLEFRTDERNEVSRKAIEKIGGKFEGVLRNHMLMPDGHRRNTHCYSVLKSEWPVLKQTVFKTYASAPNG
ncbi:MAG TPA: GNAT family protein [Flavobacteriales bacterium]|nr:GNAT family protein [Flavobacteriales bacterium]